MARSGCVDGDTAREVGKRRDDRSVEIGGGAEAVKEEGCEFCVGGGGDSVSVCVEEGWGGGCERHFCSSMGRRISCLLVADDCELLGR